MKNVSQRRGRLRPMLRATLLFYLLCTVVLTSVHHHSTLQNGDCALCTLAHTPVLSPPSAPQPAVATASHTTVAVREEQARDSDFHQASRSRAPPQA